MTEEAKARAARRALLTGSMLVVVFGPLVLAPLLLGRWSVNRYIVALGLVGVLIGGSVLLHGAWDWMVARRRQ